jgi:hypothetical protein
MDNSTMRDKTQVSPMWEQNFYKDEVWAHIIV